MVEREGNIQEKVLFPDSPHSNPTKAYRSKIQNESFAMSNNTRARSLHMRVRDANNCTIRNENHKRGPTVTPADSSHIWVHWDWEWFYTHCYPCNDACDPKGQVMVLVDGEPQTIHLRDNTQHFALVKADPCLKHEITMKVFSFSEKTKATTYNSNTDKSLYSGYLHQTINQRICLNKDNSTVKVLEVFESLRFCIMTEGDQKFAMTELTSSTAAGSVDLTIVNPEKNLDSDQPDKINITVPVIGIRGCNNSGDEEDEGNPDLTTIQTTTQTIIQTTSSESEKESQKYLAATIAIPLAMLTLLIVGLIAGYIFHQKRKQGMRPGSETVDENPIYGEEMYMRDETGDMRQTTVVVTDSSPFCGGSTGEWDGAYVTDSNEYYA